jgi:exonuclease III
MKFISLNIEKDGHIEGVLEFLKKENPDVVCLQEIFIEHFEKFKKDLYMQGVFAQQMFWRTEDEVVHKEGVAILSKLPILSSSTIPYTKNADVGLAELSRAVIPEIQVGKGQVVNITTRTLLVAEIEGDNKIWKFATTHFTWGYYGYVDKQSNKFVYDVKKEDEQNQMDDLGRLLNIFADLKDFVFSADLNAPRGMLVFDTMAKKYKDNIPKEYDTSVDQNLHRVKGLKLMVDGLFSTSTYKASNVKLVDGLSDHMAIVAEIAKED